MQNKVKPKTCEVCSTNDAKYTCPKCDIRTCSLSCVRAHKREINCDGLHTTTKYKPLEQLDSTDILADLDFLNSASSYVLKCATDKRKQWTRYNVPLPKHLFKLKKVAYNRGITLRFLPRHFERHKNNTTFLDWTTDQLYWKIEWIFSNATNTLVLVDEKVLDGQKLCTALEKYLLPEKHFIEEMDPYYQAGCENVVTLFKQEGINKTYLLLDPEKSIRDNLTGQVVIEHPTIYVVLLSNLNSYNLSPINLETIKSEPHFVQDRPNDHYDTNNRNDVKLEESEIDDATTAAQSVHDEEYEEGDDNKFSVDSVRCYDDRTVHHISKFEMEHYYKNWYDDIVGLGGINRFYKDVCDTQVCYRKRCARFHCENKHHRARSEPLCAIVCELKDCDRCRENNSRLNANVLRGGKKCDYKFNKNKILSTAPIVNNDNDDVGDYDDDYNNEDSKTESPNDRREKFDDNDRFNNNNNNNRNNRRNGRYNNRRRYDKKSFFNKRNSNYKFKNRNKFKNKSNRPFENKTL